MKNKNKNTLINNNTTKSAKNVKNNKALTRIKDWSSYNAGMIDRGHFRKLAELAVSEIKKEISSRAWKQHKAAGRPKTYPDALILVIAVFREIFGMTFREAEGFAKDVFEEFGISVPDYTTIERRIGELKIDLHLDKRRLKSDLYIMADSTGYKVFGEGEWKTYKHGRSKRRNIAEVLGDGAYNTKALKKYVEEECKAKLISPPKIKPKSGGTKFIGADNEANERCNEIGRDQWKDEVGYHKRSLVETNMFREKSPFGDKLKCKTIKNQIAEITIRAMILNIWTNEWMPKYTKTNKNKTKP